MKNLNLLTEERLSSDEYLSYEFQSYTYKNLPDGVKLYVGNHLDNLRTTGIKFLYLPNSYVNTWTGMRTSVVGYLLASYICKQQEDRKIKDAVICDDVGRLLWVDANKEDQFINELLLDSCKFFSDIPHDDFQALTLGLLDWKDKFLQEITGDISFMSTWKNITRHNFIKQSLLTFLSKEENQDLTEEIAKAKEQLQQVEDNIITLTTQFLKIKNLYLNLKHN